MVAERSVNLWRFKEI